MKHSFGYHLKMSGFWITIAMLLCGILGFVFIPLSIWFGISLGFIGANMIRVSLPMIGFGLFVGFLGECVEATEG